MNAQLRTRLHSPLLRLHAAANLTGSASLARKTSALRARTSGHATSADILAASAPMEQLLQEEDHKRRGK